MSTADAERRHDLVVWGATGVAGRLVAEYLTERYAPDDCSLAIGGERDEAKLDALAGDLTDGSDDWGTIPMVLGDATDPESLRALAERLREVGFTATVGAVEEGATA
jgi:short subunit dehydrogenase-like uncharacterized protein